jgi:hypothetical protein
MASPGWLPKGAWPLGDSLYFRGLFIALGIAPFFLGDIASQMLGFGYLAIAVVRLVSIFIDHSTAQSNLISLAIEILFGLILILRH